jgi:hypothetical protein
MTKQFTLYAAASAFGGTEHYRFKRYPTRLNQIISFYRFLLNDFKSFNSLFKVLFIFPSQYLFAIGFP